MFLSILGGMAKRGMQLNDERRAIDQQVELTKKLENIKDEYAQRRSARASASKAKANAKKYMSMLMPLVGGDEELAKKIYSQYQDSTGDVIANGISLQAMGVPFIKDGTVNPIVNLPDVDVQKSYQQNLALNGNDEQKESANLYLTQLAEVENIGASTGFDVGLSNKLHTSIKKGIDAEARADASLATAEGVVMSAEGMVVQDSKGAYATWLQQNAPAIIIDQLTAFNVNPNVHHLYLRPYIGTNINDDSVIVTPLP